MAKDTKDKKSTKTGRFRDQHIVAAREVKGKPWSIAKERNSAINGNKASEMHAGYYATKHGAVATTDNFYGGGVHVVPTSEKISIIRNGISKKQLEEIKDQS